MIVCTCKQTFEHSEDFLSHQKAAKDMGDKSDHTLCCSRCRKIADRTNVWICELGKRIYSVICGPCHDHLVERIENGCR